MSPDPAAYRDAVVAGEATLEDAATAAKGCQACRLWQRGTQTVFGAGPVASARVMFIGEQPGDREDVTGRPFVGPAGRLLDDALDEAGIDRKTAYLTNVVKHFSWEQRGKRRIHKKPKSDEIRACRPWLEAEVAALQPDLVVCLGATAAQAVLGSSFRVTQGRGIIVESTLAPRVLATVHPSSILRAPDSETRALEFRRLVADLQVAAQALATPRAKAMERPQVAPRPPVRRRRRIPG